MGVRWRGLPVSPLLDKTKSLRAAALPHRALFTSHPSLKDSDSAISDQILSMDAPPPPSPRLRPSPPQFPSVRIQIPSSSSLTLPKSQQTLNPSVLSPKPVNQLDSPCRSRPSKKRPPKLQIPLQTPSPGLQESEERRHVCQDMNVDGGFYGLACRKGRRDIMEDTFCAFAEINGDPAHAFFGVFDGHGGRNAAEFAAKHLARNILDAAENQSQKKVCIESAVRSGYLSTDAAFLQTRASSGTCCVTALVKDGTMVVANAGDCRAVVSKSGTAFALTSDHRVSRQDERQRIESLGGYVDCFSGVWRVHGSLAISRGIGDAHFKKWISAEPEIKTLHITPDCEFLLLASDGLWDAVPNQEAVDCARKMLLVSDAADTSLGSSKPQIYNVCNSATPKSDNKASSPLLACRELVKLAVGRGCLDDISVMVVNLQHFFKDATAL